MNIKRFIGIAAVAVALSPIIGCQRDKQAEPPSIESTVMAARAVGVYIEVEKYWDDRGDGYGAYFYRLNSYIDLSGVGPTDQEMVSAIQALRQFDGTIDRGQFKVSQAREAHYRVARAIETLQQRRAELREKHPTPR